MRDVGKSPDWKSSITGNLFNRCSSDIEGASSLGNKKVDMPASCAPK